MASRTRSRGAAKGRSARAPVKAVGRRRSGKSSYATFHDLLVRREALGVALILFAGFAPWLGPLPGVLADARSGFVELFGLLTFAWVLLFWYAGWLIIRDEQAQLWQSWKVGAIGLLAALFLAGFFGFFRPEWSVGGGSLADHTAGGELGHRLAGNPFGIIAWLAIAATAFAMVWPQAAGEVVRNAPGAVRTAWGWRLPHRAAHAAKTAFEFVFPTRPEPQGSVKVPLDSVMWAQTSGAVADVDEDDEPEPPMEPVQAAMFPEQETDAESEDAGVTIDARGNRRSRDGWQLPAMDLLADKVAVDAGTTDNLQRAALIEETLASFGVDARVVQINEGPTVTQFGIEPGWEIKTRTVTERDRENKIILDKDGTPKTRVEEVSRTRVRVQQITSLANDLALALAAPAIRIEAPVPGKPVLGIEVPNTSKSLVTLR
ncbi:MAG: hypothetical protein EPO22_09730, partial [Dehalococcoidia bacterium]